MTQSSPQFRVKLAQTEDELRAAQRLRYDVFVV
ncbi:MAG: ornithine-acyl-ACP acyltransferase, partial [Rhodobacteraceae bacterium]|nr:ornithine-acyl-ACP acyltransferase [Paracoccaceae bacterium]